MAFPVERSARSHLLIFAKYPRAGEVKTRLAATLGADPSAWLYRAFLLDALDLYRSLRPAVEPVLLLSDAGDIEPMLELLAGEGIDPDDITIRAQRGETLGERLRNGFDEAFAGGARAACAIGSDHPTLPLDYVTSAFAALGDHDMAIGPADDGGYYLIALRRAQNDLFAGMPYSTPELFAETMRAAARMGLRTSALPAWYDVDDHDSLLRLWRERGLLPAGSRTLRVLGTLGLPASPAEGAGRSIGIYGGTFDPVHNAHLLLAESARESLGLDQVLFLPAFIPPHKVDGRALTPADCRLEMLRLAIASNPGFALSTTEIASGKVNYTVDTLALLRAEYPLAALTLLIGGDSARDFPGWRRPEEIAAMVSSIGVMARPGVELPEEILPGVSYRRVDSPLMEISSTDIRERVGRGESIRYRVPDQVIEYINEHGLYR